MAVERRNFIFPSSWTDAQQIAQLEIWLSWVNEEILSGKTTSAWSSGDTNASKWVDLSLPAERRKAMILNDLSILSSDTHNPRDLMPIRWTTPRYI